MATRKAPAVKRSAAGFVRCRVCGCTNIEAYDPPGAWASDARGDLCTTCDTAAVAITTWMQAVRRVNLSGLFREVHRRIREATQATRRSNS